MKTLSYTVLAAAALAFSSCGGPAPAFDVAVLCDGDASTFYKMPSGQTAVAFSDFSAPIRSYEGLSSGESPENDPSGWILSGSRDGRKWEEIDRCSGVSFCSRFQPVSCSVANPSNYTAYKLEFLGSKADSIAVGEVVFREDDPEAGWDTFTYPKVDFEVLDPQTEGARIYASMVQNPEEYVRWHTRKVAEILFWSAADTMNAVGKIDYTLKDYPGVSAKSGTPAETAIVYSTQHVEKSAAESLYKLDYETRGVLYHELVHAYQFEPKGIGTYSTNKEFWACIEGLADAVRAEAGYFDIEARRKPGGNWLDGYQTTGFFIQWLTTKDPDAIRKFHVTVRDLDVWSFDKAMKSIFGPEHGIREMWNEYQAFLISQKG